MYILVPSFHTLTCSPLLVAVLLLSTIPFIFLTDTQLLGHGVSPDVEIPINLYRTVFVSTLVIALACAHTSLNLGILLSGVLGRFLSTWLRPGASVVTDVTSGSAIPYRCPLRPN